MIVLNFFNGIPNFMPEFGLFLNINNRNYIFNVPSRILKLHLICNQVL